MIKTESSSQTLARLLGDTLDYSRPDTSFSPFYSDVGLGIDAQQGGIRHLYLHYNRRTTAFLDPFLPFPAPTQAACAALSVHQTLPQGSVMIAFCGHNTWLVEAQGGLGSSMHFADANLTEARRAAVGTETILFDGYLPNGDPRDPDKRFPLVVGLRLLRGHFGAGDGLSQPVQLQPDSEGVLLLAFSARMLAVEHEPLLQRLNQAAPTIAEALRRSQEWLDAALGQINLQADEPREAAVLARAAHALISNASEAPGFLAGRVSAFPSRGRYPTHFLWDSCFQNLALEEMEPRLASDSLLLLTENLRPDGKMPHFICSTWIRPHESQPPLVGWAGQRLIRRRGDTALARQLLPALRRNTQWWLNQRMTRWGLICALHGLETGWDDSPRFDQGATISCDMNAYLLMQMRACAEMAELIGDTAGAAQDRALADEYAQRMVDVLYDRESGLFWDRNVEQNAPVRLKTPACFLPLWAGAPLPETDARRAIESHLLNPSEFFGAVPFPSVAYDEPVYQAEKWWRGPTWLAVAYLMLELLDKYGYAREALAARQRLYAMLIRDGDLREHFNSQTGEGLGAYEQGWTAAICLRLRTELRNH